MTDAKKSLVASLVMLLASISSAILTAGYVFNAIDSFEISGETYRKLTLPLLVVMLVSAILVVYFSIRRYKAGN